MFTATIILIKTETLRIERNLGFRILCLISRCKFQILKLRLQKDNYLN
jgi:hypothetical protein